MGEKIGVITEWQGPCLACAIPSTVNPKQNKTKHSLKLSNGEGKATYSKRKYICGARSEGRGNEYKKA